MESANLSVNPVLITLDGSDSIAAMTLTNRGEESVVMQASVSAWSIRDNKEHYEPTARLIVTPAYI
ncbi:MAG: fimbria/pilus periplasmic chaperone [Marinobacter sp.]|nr:fimbria/pilus periplasmic chaperone [Marinobacter sp.]